MEQNHSELAKKYVDDRVDRISKKHLDVSIITFNDRAYMNFLMESFGFYRTLSEMATSDPFRREIVTICKRELDGMRKKFGNKLDKGVFNIDIDRDIEEFLTCK